MSTQDPFVDDAARAGYGETPASAETDLDRGGPIARLRSRIDRKASLGLDRLAAHLRHRALGSWLHARHFASLELNEVDVSLRMDTALAGIRIAFVSDIHSGPFMDRDDLESLFRRIAEAEPDIVCLGGDLVSARHPQIEFLDRALALLSPRLGLYGVLGNHEYHDESAYDVLGFLERAGVTTLINRGVRIERNGASLWLGGVDDLRRGDPDIESALRGRRPREATLLLSHNPDIFPEAAELGVDLTLSGHTHGGQIRLFGWAPITNSEYRYRDGIYRIGASQLFLGRGAGSTAVPLRVGAPPEVPIVRLVG